MMGDVDSLENQSPRELDMASTVTPSTPEEMLRMAPKDSTTATISPASRFIHSCRAQGRQGEGGRAGQAVSQQTDRPGRQAKEAGRRDGRADVLRLMCCDLLLAIQGLDRHGLTMAERKATMASMPLSQP